MPQESSKRSRLLVPMFLASAFKVVSGIHGPGSAVHDGLRSLVMNGALGSASIAAHRFLDELRDCNGNGVHDADDIASGASHDCNHNGVPDECDTATGVSPDTDQNLTPDECDPRVAYFRFDEGAGDSTVDATGGPPGLLAGPTWASVSGDPSGTSLLFDGLDDCVELGTLDLPPAAMSISLWMRASQFDVSDARLISKAAGLSESAHLWMVSTVSHGGQMRLRARLKTSASTTTLIGAGGALALGVWTHVAATYDGVTLRLYEDSVLVGSVAQSGLIATSPSLPVAVGNQPLGAGNRPFAGHLDDVRIFDRALGRAELQTLAGVPVTAPNGLAPQITVWCGQPQPDGSNLQRFGHLGVPQAWVNLLGNVDGPHSPVISLHYTLNGGPIRGLGMGPDTRRLLEAGDFNVDLLYAELLPLPQINTVVITAEDQVGNLTEQLVRVAYDDSVVAPGSFTVDWDGATDLQDLVQVVDGHFVVQNGRIRPDVLGYDRLIAIGDLAHSSYEVQVPVIVHGIDSAGFPYPNGGPLVGLGLRWLGHVDAAIVNPSFFGPGPEQPEWGFFPAGGYAWFHWTSPSSPTTGRFEVVQNFFQGSSTQAELFEFGTTYMFKARITTVNDRPRLQLKRWRPATQAEPSDWLLTRNGAVGDPTHGAVVLISHYADVEFGDVVVTQLP